jgi:hypothetical protein
MPFQYNKAGISHVGSYQVSGRPFITGSADIDNNVQHKIEFPAVTKSIKITSRSDVDLRIHFNDKADGGVFTGLHYVTLVDNKDSVTLNVRCKEIYITSTNNNGAYELYAELTSIPSTEMFVLTGSGLTD